MGLESWLGAVEGEGGRGDTDIETATQVKYEFSWIESEIELLYRIWNIDDDVSMLNRTYRP